MPINPNSGSEISLQDAQTLVGDFRSKFPKENKAAFVGSQTISLILNQSDCVGVRIYNGYDATLGAMTPVLVGVDSTGKDMTNGVIIDRLKLCPDFCDTASSLNK